MSTLPIEEPPVAEPMGIPPEAPIGPPITKFDIGGGSVELTEEEQDALRYIFETMPQPDDDIREKMTPIWQMYENYWRGLQNVVYDSETGTFLSAAGVLQSAGELEDTYIGSKVVNMYRARGESIAAAVSTGEPAVKFYPEDADDPQDVNTAKAYSVASKFIGEDNESKLLHLRAIYTRWNQPFVAYYNTYVYDEAYGTLEKRRYSSREENRDETFCPQCGEDIDPVQAPNGICPECGVQGQTESVTETVPQVDEIFEIPKGREKIEVYGPRHVRVPYNVVKLTQAGYLILETEHHWAQLVDLHPQLEELILEGSPGDSTTSDAARTHRRALEGGNADEDQNTLYRCWFRPWAFHLVESKEIRASLRSKFPSGVQVTFVDEHFVEAYDESMDDHWTLVPDPFAEHIHGDPLGKPMIPLQDMTNDTVQLTLETILYGIPDSFADPTVLNFQKYSEAEKSPGNMFPAKRPSGMNLDSGFFQSRPTTLSDNVEIFRQALDSMGMSVTGDFPGIHGGPLPKGSSRTADEYRQAKQSALQRLSIIWLLINKAWAKVMEKAVNELREHMVFQGEDVKFVQEAGTGFTNVWIKLSDIDAGNVGRVKSEESDSFPLSTEQQRGALLELLQTGVPELISWMFTPQNLNEMTRVLIGMNNFKVPGADDRNYQLEEIHDIMIGQPAVVDPDMDNHEAHAATIQEWGASEDGRKAKEQNPQGYMMVLEHLQQHLFVIEMMAQQQAAMAPPPQGTPPQGGQAEESGAAEPVPPSEG